jgi:hypothetical protein
MHIISHKQQPRRNDPDAFEVPAPNGNPHIKKKNHISRTTLHCLA